VLRSCFRTHDGREVNQTGDGFFTVFEQPLAALQCSVARPVNLRGLPEPFELVSLYG
jgi:class 3 adenylate cyclase